MMIFNIGSLLNMSEVVTFFTGLFVGIAAAFVLKGKANQIPREMATANKLLKAAVKGKGDYKMVFVVRNDLGMSKGKVAAQCAHATLMCYKLALDHCPEGVKLWSYSGQAKIALKLDGNAQELLKLADKASEIGVVNALVRDDGRTQVERGTITVLGLGPSPAQLIDKVSGHLKLL